MRRAVRVAIGLCLAAAAMACRTDGPRDIDTAADACSRCRMSIDRLDHAGELITADGRVQKYDSLGCLALDHRDAISSGRRPAGAWVIDHATHRWIRAGDAYYALAGMPTDHMGYGIAASASREAAVALAGGDAGKVVGWTQLHQRVLDMEPRSHD